MSTVPSHSPPPSLYRTRRRYRNVRYTAPAVVYIAPPAVAQTGRWIRKELRRTWPCLALSIVVVYVSPALYNTIHRSEMRVMTYQQKKPGFASCQSAAWSGRGWKGDLGGFGLRTWFVIFDNTSLVW